MKTTHTLSSIKVLEDIRRMSIDLSIEVKDKLEQVLKLMKAEGKTKDDEAFKIIVDLLY